MPPSAILAVDQGSSSSRCVAFDADLKPLARATRRLATSRPEPGMVEHDPADLLAGVVATVREAMEAIDLPVAGIGIANQTESFVIWERDGGRAVSPVVSWQDRRAAGLCRELAAHPTGRRVRELTGLALDPTFSAPKLAWLFARDPDLHARAAGGELAFGDVACWLAWHLGGGRHVTEPSNACRTLLVDLTTLTWDAALLDLFGVPAALLPEIRRSDDLDVRAGGHPAGVDAPVAAVLGDQPAALYGQGCTSPGMAALTLGTGAFLWSNVGPERPRPPQGVLATAAWHTDRFGPTYALEAFGANAGNALAILRSLGLIPKGWASAAPDWSRPHPVVVPAPAGLGTPRWDGADRITVLGASGTTSPEQLASACLAGVAHQIADALEAMEAQARPTGPLRVGGGLAADTALLQTVADLSGRSLEVAADLEATTRGIAALAATAVGLPGPEGPAEAAGRTIAPRLDGAGRARERERWHEAVDVHLATADGG